MVDFDVGGFGEIGVECFVSLVVVCWIEIDDFFLCEVGSGNGS